MKSKIVYSVPVTEKKQGETAVRRHPDAVKELLNPELQTMQGIWNKSVKENANKLCIEERTYQEVDKMATSIGSWMAKNKYEVIYIHSRNRPEWTIVDIACWKYGVISVPLYDTLGKEALEHTFRLTQGKLIFSSKQSVEALLKNKPSTINVIKQMVLLDDITQEQQKKLKQLKINVCKFNSILNEKTQPAKTVKPTDVLSYVFTSGTTGIPKGAILTNYNLACQGPATKKMIRFSNDEIHFSYLPLPHAYERMVQSMMLAHGSRICFSSGVVADFMKDIARVKPTFLPVVPRIFNMLYQVVKPLSHVSKQVGQAAFKEKKQNYEKGIKTSSYDEQVFKRINNLFGGRLRFIVTGSAPIAPEIITFFKIVLDAKIFEGYGQTETTAVTFICDPEQTQLGHVGGPTQLIEFKLVDIPQMKYLSTDQNPRGEICVKGYSVFKGYYKDKQNTDETIDKDGWHHSGDVGQLLPNGAVKIIDRKKNIYKLSQGQYIAPQKIQNVYKQNPIVSDIFVYGDSMRNFNIAIIVPNPVVLNRLGITGDLEALSKDSKANQFVLKQLTQTGKKQGLFGFQQAKRIVLYPNPFVTTGILTNTMKLQRHEAKNFFKDVIQKAYKSK